MPVVNATTRTSVMAAFWVAVSFAALIAFEAQAAEPLDLNNCFWHLRFMRVFEQEDTGEDGSAGEVGEDDKKMRPPPPKNIDAYLISANGKLDRGVATARAFNTSVHQVTKSTLVLDGPRLKGDLEFLLTPDSWVPFDGQTRRASLTVDGAFVPTPDDKKRPYKFEGTYTGNYVTAKTAEPRDVIVKGEISGAAEAAKAPLVTGVWEATMNQLRREEGEMDPAVAVSVGVSDGKILWAEVGRTYRGRAHSYRFDPKSLVCDGKKLAGTMTMPARALDPMIDPEVLANMELEFTCVQGLVVGHVKVAYALNGKPAAHAA